MYTCTFTITKTSTFYLSGACLHQIMTPALQLRWRLGLCAESHFLKEQMMKCWLTAYMFHRDCFSPPQLFSNPMWTHVGLPPGKIPRLDCKAFKQHYSWGWGHRIKYTEQQQTYGQNICLLFFWDRKCATDHLRKDWNASSFSFFNGSRCDCLFQ